MEILNSKKIRKKKKIITTPIVLYNTSGTESLCFVLINH